MFLYRVRHLSHCILLFEGFIILTSRQMLCIDILSSFQLCILSQHQPQLSAFLILLNQEVIFVLNSDTWINIVYNSSCTFLDFLWNRTSTARSIAKRCTSAMWTNCVTCTWSVTITQKLRIPWSCTASFCTGRTHRCRPCWRAISTLPARHTDSSRRLYTMILLTISTKER